MDTNGHTILSEDYVSFEVAKLLKEKEFNEPCYCVYFIDNLEHHDYSSSNFELVDNAFTAPTLQMAMKWLREVHNIVINIIYEQDNMQVFAIDIITTNGTFYIGNYNHYESAVEAALKYTLKNLI